ncbi:hypothetical protein Tco_1387155 [Tanacetum coccineum]
MRRTDSNSREEIKATSQQRDFVGESEMETSFERCRQKQREEFACWHRKLLVLDSVSKRPLSLDQGAVKVESPKCRKCVLVNVALKVS